MENTQTEKTRLMDNANPYEFRGRFNKAHKIVRFCRAHGISPEQLHSWDEEKWEMMLPLMPIGKKIPSDVCIGMAVGLLQPAPHRRPRTVEAGR